MNHLRFESGTIVLSGEKDFVPPRELFPFFRADPRTGNFRAPASAYFETVLSLRKNQIPFRDEAREYETLSGLELKEALSPYLHQQTALAKWSAAGYRGIVSLPTGSGKTILAVLAIARLRRSTLVLVPTIDLLSQWAGVLERFFGMPVSMLGGGSHEVGPLTVSTYDSAALNMEFIGSRFGFLIADECHHLPAPESRIAAAMAIAPFRLGLSATPDADGERREILEELLGPLVCDIGIDELEGKILANYRVLRIPVPLSPEEEALYRENRKRYTDFLRANEITFRTPEDWGRFLGACARRPGGQEALRAFLLQRKIARGGETKLQRLETIFRDHPGERCIVFTADNETAYEIGRRFTLPVLTCHTKAAERKDFLDCFRRGEYPVLVTSKVLNEGVDVPAAAVGVVISGSGSVREHVQRLGRILRPAKGKAMALLYELVSAGTSELSVSDRRRTHRAYRKGGFPC